MPILFILLQSWQGCTEFPKTVKLQVLGSGPSNLDLRMTMAVYRIPQGENSGFQAWTL